MNDHDATLHLKVHDYKKLHRKLPEKFYQFKLLVGQSTSMKRLDRVSY